ncbi:hypothetical protein, partial [Hyphomonas sp.]|uniref:hypothetical protein n=1 Tax=Hyphomonas sp. TaxID=87 RepID=UPI003297751B
MHQTKAHANRSKGIYDEIVQRETNLLTCCRRLNLICTIFRDADSFGSSTFVRVSSTDGGALQGDIQRRHSRGGDAAEAAERV